MVSETVRTFSTYFSVFFSKSKNTRLLAFLSRCTRFLERCVMALAVTSARRDNDGRLPRRRRRRRRGGLSAEARRHPVGAAAWRTPAQRRPGRDRGPRVPRQHGRRARRAPAEATAHHARAQLRAVGRPPLRRQPASARRRPLPAAAAAAADSRSHRRQRPARSRDVVLRTSRSYVA